MAFRDLLAPGERRFILLGAALMFFGIGASQAIYGPFYPYFRELFDLSAADVGVLGSLHFGGATGAVFVGGMLVRRLGFRPVLVAAGIAFVIGWGTVALGVSWGLVRVGVLLIGVGFGGVVNLNMLVDEEFGELGSAALNFINAAFAAGAIAAPLVAAAALTFTGHRPAFLAGAVVGLAGLIGMARMPRREDRGTEARSSLGWAAAGTVAFLTLFALYVGAEASSSQWIATALADVFEQAGAAGMTALFWATATVGRLVAVRLSTFMTPGRLVTVSAVGSMGAFLVARIPGWAVPGFGIAGLFMGPIFPGGLAWIRRTFPARATRISATVIAGAGVGGAIFPPAVGATVDLYGPTTIPTALAGIIAAVAVACLAIGALFRPQRADNGSAPAPGGEE